MSARDQSFGDDAVFFDAVGDRGSWLDDREIEDVESLDELKLPLRVIPIPVVDAVGHVARLLYLGQDQSGSDGVNRPRSEKEDVSDGGANTMQEILGPSFPNRGRETLAVDTATETLDQLSTGLGVEHDPHLGLAVVALVLSRPVVVGMHLDREPLGRVEELDEQREAIGGEGLLVSAADEVDAKSPLELRQTESG